MKKLFFLTFTLLLVILSEKGFSKQKTFYKDKRIVINIVSGKEFLSRNEDTLLFAVKISIAKGWHIYWVNPGDAGTPTLLSVSTNLECKNLIGPLFPIPKRKVYNKIVTFEHSGTLYFPFAVILDKPISSNKIEISLDAKWLICKEKCIPCEARISKKFAINTKLPHSDYDYKVGYAFSNFPRDTVKGKIEFFDDFSLFHIDFQENPNVERVFFFPKTEGLFDIGEYPTFKFQDNKLVIKINNLRYAWGDKSLIEGLLEMEFSKGNKKYFWVKIVN
ncbi:MAG: protein-disulfide reductase DsbD family protein [Ignavibacteria bacterium]|nr:protein-disulfide reductase DsbD family protein [Ignavibacteria bacterium]